MAKEGEAGADAPADGLPRLLEIVRRLRDPEAGCPWDVAQDFASIAPYAIEEAYEVEDAIARGAWNELEGELGDLLLQTVYHALMGEEAGLFNFDSVANAVADKMVARHPHVFGDEPNDDGSDERLDRAWEAAKAAEREAMALDGALDGVALALPALTRAVKLQKRAAREGFDWPDTAQVVDKVAEEARELNDARERLSREKVAEEFGDLLFVLANLARHMGVDPEAALRGANAKFERRFALVEAKLSEMGKRPRESDLEEMDALWDKAKAEEREEKSDTRRKSSPPRRPGAAPAR